MKRSAFMMLLFASACSGDPAAAPTITADVFSWSNSMFNTGLPVLDAATDVRVKITEPLSRTVVEEDTYGIDDSSANLSEIPFGEDLRIDFEVLDATGSILASGATPTFDFEEDDQLRSYRLQISPVSTFAPVASVVVDRNTKERKFAWSRFDYRATDASWLGRTGHATAETSEGKILIVGGGDPVPGSGSPAELPEFRGVYDDIQVFDPSTGYFTDLAYDDEEGRPLEAGKDRLFEPVVHHTLTSLGNDRFLVVGGFTPRSDVMRPVNTIQVIDLTQPKGSRVTRLTDADGSSLVLQKARGWHTATYRKSDKHVIVAGGIGPQGNTDVLGTFEMIDLAANKVYGDTFALAAARAQHSAVVMADGSSVWLIGGRDGSGAVRSTEVVKLMAGGTTESAAESDMKTGRYELGAVRVSPGGGELVLVAGGFTDLDGTPTNTFEISKIGRGSFESGSTWTLTAARGGPQILELPQTQNLVVIGGLGAEGEPVATADRLVFTELTAVPPYDVEASEPSFTPRYGASANLISTGQILLVGGEGEVEGSDAALDSADIHNPLDPVGGIDSGDGVVIVTTDE